jgi:caffeoyl-CoA O-methyltransferase
MASYERALSRLDEYVIDLFAKEDAALQWIQEEADRNELPQISIRAHEGKILQVLLRAVGARKVVEIGTLAGYSATWIARALPVGGKLYTMEKSSKHAEIARRGLERAGVADKVEIMEGQASDLLEKLIAHGPFDFVFLDADRPSYVKYLEWAARHIRPGGMLTAHNAYRGGRIVAPENDDDRAMAAFNQALAVHPQFDGVIIGVGDALAAAVKVR